MASVETRVEEHYKNVLNNIGVRYYEKTESINSIIDEELRKADSKSGGSGANYPDLKLLLKNSYNRAIPVMIEAKGSKDKLIKYEKNKDNNPTEFIEQVVRKKDKANYNSIKNYAVNGALHYGLACLNSEEIDEVIIIGINGTELNEDGSVKDPEFKAYYVSKKNNKVPKEVELSKDWVEFKKSNVDKFFEYLDTLNLTAEEIKRNEEKAEADLEERVHAIHQKLYDDGRLKNPLSTNEKLYLFCGLIMAGLKTEGLRPLGVTDLYSNDDPEDNDGEIILRRISAFLKRKDTSKAKADMIIRLLNDVFKKKVLWQPTNGASILKELFGQIKDDIIPLLESDWHLDFTGKILNRLSDWVSIDNDKLNDVVLTPRYITRFMARLARTNMNSFVWDRAMGSGGFLVSAMDIMIADAKEKIKDADELDAKISKIKKEQLLGVEILGNIYILAVLNMILMGDGSSNIINENSHKRLKEYEGFEADVFLLNPPYSAPGKGLNFVEETLDDMCKIHEVTKREAYACILIQENAGSGQGNSASKDYKGNYARDILKKNTLLASIHMPADLFGGKASVQTAIYLFKIARPHEEDDLVTFIDMSKDGYTRQNRKKSSQEVNLRDTDDAVGRYDEVVAKLLGKKANTDYYNEKNGTWIRDSISLEGNDWTFNQHVIIDTTPSEEDFKKTVADYLSWKVSAIMKGQVDVNV